jgi:hypothetical protein
LISLFFESGSQVETIESEAFSGCEKVPSLSLPASLAVLSARLLTDNKSLTSLSFEPGSKLTTIENYVFTGCSSMKTISLPASLCNIQRESFSGLSGENLIIDAGNPHYFVSGDFLIGFDGMTLFRHIGRSETVLVVPEIECLGEHCFGSCKGVKRIVFGLGSRLARISPRAFEGCSILSIRIPAAIRVIPEGCFEGCLVLAELRFEPGSQLCRIEKEALGYCLSLAVIDIPAQLEIIESGIFRDCKELCLLSFEMPSRLKSLDLPPSAFRSISIPDSVEILSGYPQGCRMEFGVESGLRELDLHVQPTSSYARPVSRNIAFVRLSEGALRRFRCTL